MTTAAPPKIEKTPVDTSAPQRQSKNPRVVKAAIFLAKVIFWQLIALLAVEAVLAVAGLGEEEIFKLDPKYGFVHMNNKSVTWRSEGFSRSYFGPDGMREPNLTIQKPAGVFRVALLGDSIVESLQVPLEDTFGQVLEKSLKKTAAGKELQVLNFGNSGYSTAQEYLQLKNKVLKYSPDAVIVFYNHRDIFENWAPPDQTITNVRPYALHLPNLPLTIDSASVAHWMKSPRGKFLTSITWIREHSRVWGLIAAWETQASFHDPVYRAVVGFFTSPVKTTASAVASLSSITPKSVYDAAVQSLKSGATGASFNIKFIDEKRDKASQKAASAQSSKSQELDPAKASYILNAPSLKDFPAANPLTEEEKNAAAAKVAEAKSAEAKALVAKAAEQKAKDIYFNLMFKTLRSLFSEMKQDCEKHGAKFAIATAPSKLSLVETQESIGSMEMPYDKEIAVVRDYCQKENVPFADLQADLQKMKKEDAFQLFYSMHLTKQGHDYVVKEAQSLFQTLIDDREKSQ